VSFLTSLVDIFFWLFQDGAFWIFAATTVVAAVAVVVTQNVVRMAFWLILSLGSMAGLFFSLNADFVASAQLLIYVGGTLVLLIFGVMLTASGPFVSIKANPGGLLMSGVVGGLLLSLILYSACAVDWVNIGHYNTTGGVASGFNAPQEGTTTRELGLSFIGARPDKDLGSPGAILTSGYLLPFEIVSVHLLVVLVGAAYLARAKRRKEPAPPAAPG
jgi:NADH:ubiquinone oxidoreductase subunit 6 (subunit J)